METYGSQSGKRAGKTDAFSFRQANDRRRWTAVHIWTKFFQRTVVQVRRFERFALIQAASPLIGQRVITTSAVRSPFASLSNENNKPLICPAKDERNWNVPGRWGLMSSLGSN
jgi:hypothetical protein